MRSGDKWKVSDPYGSIEVEIDITIVKNANQPFFTQNV